MIDQETLKNALEYDSNTGVFVRLISGRGRNSRIGDVAGMFDSPEDAHQAYLVKKRQLHEGCTI